MRIELPERAEAALSRLAIRERRDLRAQAEVCVLERLEELGLITSARSGTAQTATEFREGA